MGHCAHSASGHIQASGEEKTDNTIEWAHFVERNNGLKEKVMRGTVNSLAEFDMVIDTVRKNHGKIFGVTLQSADYDIRTLDGRKASDTIH